MNLNQDQSFERVLEAAVIVNWADLMYGADGLIHVEYGFGPRGAVDLLQVWTSKARGYWLLACTFRMAKSGTHDTGIQFDNEYQSEGLAHDLAALMQGQNAFALPRNFGRPGLLQIAKPTEGEHMAATTSMRDAASRVNGSVESVGPTH